MATPPPVAKQIPASFAPFAERLPSDLGFDIGINSSDASWAEHLDHAPLSGDGTENASPEFDTDVCPARVLYNFEGNTEYQEMTVRAGDEIEVLREDAGEGWSLVRALMGEIGLLPATYYTVGALFCCSRRYEAFLNFFEVYVGLYFCALRTG